MLMEVRIPRPKTEEHLLGVRALLEEVDRDHCGSVVPRTPIFAEQLSVQRVGVVEVVAELGCGLVDLRREKRVHHCTRM